jgi:histidyl-tRNA synthetase
MLGPRELAEGKVAVKDLASGEQVDIPRAEVSARLRMRKEESA